MLQKKCALITALLFLSFFLPAQVKKDALAMYRASKFTEAIETCLEEINENPNNLDSYVVLSWALVAAQRYQDAAKWAEQGRTIARYDPRLIEILAEAHYYQGNNEQALRLFQEYISNAPNGSRISSTYAFMGEIYIRQSKYRHADIALSTALELENTNTLWWVRLGYAREKAKEYKPAFEAYSKALELDPNLLDAERGKTRVLSLL